MVAHPSEPFHGTWDCGYWWRPCHKSHTHMVFLQYALAYGSCRQHCGQSTCHKSVKRRKNLIRCRLFYGTNNEIKLHTNCVYHKEHYYYKVIFLLFTQGITTDILGKKKCYVKNNLNDMHDNHRKWQYIVFYMLVMYFIGVYHMLGWGLGKHTYGCKLLEKMGL